MNRPTRQAYDLSDAEKRDSIALIQAAKPSPEKYRFLLFEDKREMGLVWNDKTRDVRTTVLPFQSLKHVDEPRKREQEAQTTRPCPDSVSARRGAIRSWVEEARCIH